MRDTFRPGTDTPISVESRARKGLQREASARKKRSSKRLFLLNHKTQIGQDQFSELDQRCSFRVLARLGDERIDRELTFIGMKSSGGARIA
jgi:hypothetical protein